MKKNIKKCPNCFKEHSKSTKLCNKCYFNIPKNKKKRDEIIKIYKKNNIEKIRLICKKSQFKHRHNMELFEFEEQLKKQKYKCNICGVSNVDLKVMMCLDHNHKNNQNRGIICKHCNTGLGMFKDNVKSLKKAIAYLNHYNKTVSKQSTKT